jgi:hypothetical protein
MLGGACVQWGNFANHSAISPALRGPFLEDIVKHFAGMFRLVGVFVIFVVFAFLGISAARAQDTGSLQGTVTDPTGAAASGAKITATDLSSSASHITTADKNGSYSFTQLPPGDYKVEIVKEGFKTFIQAKVSVLVATPTLLDARLELGAVTQQVVVESAAAPTINTQDATVGNTFNEREVQDLPILARNIVNLLTLQPGVVFTGLSDTDKLNMGSIATMDTREGVVDGIRGNQTDVTLDGVDSNDWQNQSAFTSALPVTPDSVEEFRVTTTNANATNGLTGGAQVQMVTRSGSDQFHGAAYWYYRTTGTSANSWFNNETGLDRPKLQRNQAGGTFGGPIKKDRVFFFLNNEERRDAIGAVEDRTVPSDSLRDGVLIYQCATPSQCAGGSVQGINTTHTVAPGYFGIPTISTGAMPTSVQSLDPEGIGVNASMVPYMNLFPHGNDPTIGDDATGGPIANFIGYRFNAPELTSQNIYIARFDYNITADGHHSLFWRGSMEGLRTDLLGAQFPGQSASQELLNNSRGFAVQYQGQMSATLVNTARYGFIREGIALPSAATGPLFDIRDFTDIQNFGARFTSHTAPVHEINDDLSKSFGKHTLTMGGVLRFITIHRSDEGNSFPQFDADDGFCVGCSAASDEITANSSLPAPSNPTAITRAFMMLTGPITDVTATFFGNPVTGAIQPTGTPSRRDFGERSFETYLQDSWRIRPNLTFTYGLRYGYETPVWETNGLEVAPSFDIMTWLKQRVNNMNAGIPASASPLLEYVLAGKVNHEQSWYDPDYKDFAPRLALAYSPSFDSGIGHMLFGGPGKTSIRLGAGIFYDNIGQPIALSSDQSGSPGTATTLTNNSQAFCLGGSVCTAATPTPAPRFAGSCTLTTGCAGLPDLTNYVTPPTAAIFPSVPASDLSSIGFGVDPGLRTPYSMHFNVDIQRELPHHFVLDVGYVGTLGRRLLGKVDYAQYSDIRDPASGQDMWTAFRQVAKIANLTPQNNATPAIPATILVGPPGNQVAEPNLAGLSQIPSIPWFTNMLPGMGTFAAQDLCSSSDAVCNSGYQSLTPTQAFYAFAVQDISGFGGGASWACAIYPIDAFVSPGGLTSPWNSTVDPNGTGLVQFTPQFATLPGWSNWASSNYHSLQISVRKSVGIASFAANYVFSKSIDNASGGENVDLGDNGSPTQASNALIENPFNHRLGRGLSDFNLRHNFNGDWVVTMPFGRGHRFFGSANRLLDALVGGWEVSGAVRWHSGFPESPSDGFDFPTNFFLTASGTLTGPVSNHLVRHGSSGDPNLFGTSSAPGVPPDAYANFGFTLPGLPGDRNNLTGPAYAATDVGLTKAFRLTERTALKFQVRAYNVFNSVNFDDSTLSLDPTSPGTFGEITGTAGPRGGAREMEFAARFEF